MTYYIINNIITMCNDEVFTFDIFVTKCLHGDIKNGLLYFQRHCEYDCINNQYIINNYRNINKTRIMDYDELKEMLDDIVLPNNSSLFNLINDNLQ